MPRLRLGHDAWEVCHGIMSVMGMIDVIKRVLPHFRLEGGVVAGQLNPPVLEPARCRPLSRPTGRLWAPSGGERNMHILLYPIGTSYRDFL